MDGDDDPFRYVAVVVGALSFVLLAVAVGVQFSAVGALTIPLVLAVPLAVGVLYWYLRW
jgi:hypothetical protein